MSPEERAREAGGVRRMNWGCGSTVEPGWFNSDLKDDPGIDHTGDIRRGLPVPDGTFDYIVSIHALPMIPIPDLAEVLAELRRVLRPGGTLRLCLPDLDLAIAAYLRGDAGYFVVPDEDERTLSGKMITQLLWYGWSTTMFTWEWTADLLQRAGFDQVRRCRIGQTWSGHEGICELDNRPDESIFVEATR